MSHDKVNIYWNTIPEEIVGDDAVQSVRLKDVVTDEGREHKTDGIFIFIGHIPNTDMFQGQLMLDKQGYIEVDHMMQTSVPGVFAAGEVADSHFRQVITSAGMGAAAAIQANHYLDDVDNQ